MCREKEYKIKEFSIEAFRQKPSYEVLCSCRKADLYEIAECYAIPVIKTARKKEVWDLIQTLLVQQGVLPAVQPSESDDANIGEVASGEEQGSSGEVLRSLSGLCPVDLKLTIQLIQLDFERSLVSFVTVSFGW